MCHLLATSAIGTFRVPPAAEGAQDKENCSLDTDNVPSCFLYDAEALMVGAMMDSMA
jgi:hypothetical protein